MTERAVTLFEIIDRRKVPQSHVASQVFEAGEQKEANQWLRNVSRMFPREEFDEVVKVFGNDEIEVTAFKVHVEYRRKQDVGISENNDNPGEDNDSA